jgi:hydroxypyruvate isomerase
VVANAIADLGFAGVISHEYTPVGDPLTSLKEAIEICTV